MLCQIWQVSQSDFLYRLVNLLLVDKPILIYVVRSEKELELRLFLSLRGCFFRLEEVKCPDKSMKINYACVFIVILILGKVFIGQKSVKDAFA